MKFSVIIPTYNRADLLERCLESLAAQTYRDFEVLVCDDGSVDNSAEVAERYKDRLNIQYIWNENWGGPARPRNIGIAASKGEWICFLDSDDWWTPNKLESCLPYLDNYDMLYHDMYIFDQDGGIRHNDEIISRVPKSPMFEDMLKYGNCCPNSSVVLRKSIVDKTGPLTEEKELVAVEDFDYWLSVSRVTERFCHINQKLGCYWIGDSSISFNEKWFARHKALYEKYLPTVENKKIKRQIEKHQNYRMGMEYQKYGKINLAQRYYFKAIGIDRLRSACKIMYLLVVNIFKSGK